MHYHQDWAIRSPFQPEKSAGAISSFEQRALATFIVLVLCYIALHLLDAWPSTIKRRLWETLVLLIPSQIIYAMDIIITKRLFHEATGQSFRKEDFGDQQAKSVALKRVLGLGDTCLGTTLQRVRSLSGFGAAANGNNAVTPPGLGNWDNSCYQNSVLQSLSALPFFNEVIQSNLELMRQVTEAPMHETMKNFLGKLDDTTNNGRTFWTPSILKSMSSWQQQDAQEYLSKVIDDIDKEVAKYVKAHKGVAGLETRIDAIDTSVPNPTIAHSTFEGLLAQRVSCKACGYSEGINLQRFNCVTVNPGTAMDYDIEQCLDQYTAPEEIEGVECVKCTILRAQAQLQNLVAKSNNVPFPAGFKAAAQARLTTNAKVLEDDALGESGVLKRCNIPAKSKVSSTKCRQEVIARSPKDLVLHINRSIFDMYGNQRKNTALVRFPAVLDLNRWCLGAKSGSEEDDFTESWIEDTSGSMLPSCDRTWDQARRSTSLYELRAVVTHHGRHENGHYVAYKKRTPGSDNATAEAKAGSQANYKQWYCCNDELVSTLSEDEVLARGGVFMLFYEAINSATPLKLAAKTEVAEEAHRVMLEDYPAPTAVSSPVVQGQVAAGRSERNYTEQNQVAQVRPEEPEDLSTATNEQGDYEDKREYRLPASELPRPIIPPRTRPIKSDLHPSTTTTVQPVAPVMRTSSFSSSSMWKERRTSAFDIPAHSIIPAV